LKLLFKRHLNDKEAGGLNREDLFLLRKNAYVIDRVVFRYIL